MVHWHAVGSCWMKLHGTAAYGKRLGKACWHVSVPPQHGIPRGSASRERSLKHLKVVCRTQTLLYPSLTAFWLTGACLADFPLRTALLCCACMS